MPTATGSDEDGACSLSPLPRASHSMCICSPLLSTVLRTGIILRLVKLATSTAATAGRSHSRENRTAALPNYQNAVDASLLDQLAKSKRSKRGCPSGKSKKWELHQIKYRTLMRRCSKTMTTTPPVRTASMMVSEPRPPPPSDLSF